MKNSERISKNAGFRGRRLHVRRLPSSAAPAFTLIELLVVAGIIILAVALAVPGVSGMQDSTRMAEAIGSLNGMLTTAQAAATAKATPVGVRIERAFDTTEEGLMDKSGSIWLDYQQMRLVTFAQSKESAFTADPNAKVHRLPKSVWLAPGYAVDEFSSLAKTNLEFTPDDITYNRFETFYIVFNKNGELTRFPGDSIVYADYTQKKWVGPGPNDFVTPKVSDPDDYDSARSLLVYDRKAWEAFGPADNTGRLNFLSSQARVVQLGRVTGSVLQDTNR